MSEDERLLHAVRDILFREWDPIGVNSRAGAEDEYDGYAPGVCRLLRRGANERGLTAHLGRLRRVSMGLSVPDETADRRVASRLLALMAPRAG
jgi:hypothetical protein